MSLTVQQECIPVGCVAVCWGGGGLVPRRGALSWRVPGRGGCGSWEVPGPGGVPGARGVVSQHALRQTPSCEQNDRQV